MSNLRSKIEYYDNEQDYEYDEPLGDYEEPDFECEEEPYFNEEELRQNAEFIEQQKKIGLMCNCELNTVLREVKKEGPNHGRLFYTCPNTYDDKCNYFMWKDESDKKISKNLKQESKQEPKQEPKKEEPEPITSEEKQDYKHLQKIGLICYCNLPSVIREVKKDGPNKGKCFYTCSRYYDDKCKYFVWKNN